MSYQSNTNVLSLLDHFREKYWNSNAEVCFELVKRKKNSYLPHTEDEKREHSRIMSLGFIFIGQRSFQEILIYLKILNFFDLQLELDLTNSM